MVLNFQPLATLVVRHLILDPAPPTTVGEGVLGRYAMLEKYCPTGFTTWGPHFFVHYSRIETRIQDLCPNL